MASRYDPLRPIQGYPQSNGYLCGQSLDTNNRLVQPSYNPGQPNTYPHTQYGHQSNTGRGNVTISQQTNEKLGNGRPIRYLCLQQPCAENEVGFARKADLQRHTQVTHERRFLPLVACEQPGCHRRGEWGFTRKDKMRDHMRDVHKVDIPKRRPSKEPSSSPASSDDS